MGRREAERDDARPGAPSARGFGAAHRDAARAAVAAGRAPARATRPRRGKPALRRAVRAHARRSRLSRPKRGRLGARRRTQSSRCPSRCRGSSPRASTGCRRPRSTCSRTPPWSARSSGSARSVASGPSGVTSRGGFTRSSARASCAESGAAPLPTRPSTRSGMRSSATSPTGRFRGSSARGSIAQLRNGSRSCRSSGARTTHSLPPIIGCRRST